MKIKVNQRNHFKGQHGFTLVELVMVIVILGVLAAVSIPAYTNFKESASLAASIYNTGAIKSQATIDWAKNFVKNTEE